MGTYVQNTPKYQAVQWTGDNQQELVDLVNTSTVAPVESSEIDPDGALFIRCPNANGFRIAPSYYLVLGPAWGDAPAPKTGPFSPEQFAARFTVQP